MENTNTPNNIPVTSYVNPVYFVSNVCRQVRCMYWGHLSHFHRAISHLKWYEIVCMRYPVHLVRWNLLTCFPCFCNLEFPDISFGDLLRFEYITSLFSCLCMPMLTSNSSGNMQKHGYLGCFHAASGGENIPWVWVIQSPPHHSRRNAVVVYRFQI